MRTAVKNNRCFYVQESIYEVVGLNVREILNGGGALVILLTLVQVSPIKINPWSAVFGFFKWAAKGFGRAVNADLLKELEEVKTCQQKTANRLDEYIRMDDERNADMHRARILQFNNELLRDILHTREDFIEILAEIDFYERYCETHSEYQNNRAVCAIGNIKRVYNDRLQLHDFL